MAELRVRRAAVGQDRDHERDDQGHALAGDLPPAAAHGQHQVDQRRDDQHLADLPDRRRYAQDQPGRHRCAGGQLRPPQQHGQGRDDRRLEPDVGHDHLFHLDLVRIQQHRRRRDRGQPPGRSPPPHYRVQQDAQGQADQVLDHRHGAHVTEHQHDLEDDLVAERVRARRGVVEVLQRVDVDQRGVVGDHGQDPQHQADGHQGGQEPVPPDQADGAGQPGRLCYGILVGRLRAIGRLRRAVTAAGDHLGGTLGQPGTRAALGGHRAARRRARGPWPPTSRRGTQVSMDGSLVGAMSPRSPTTPASDVLVTLWFGGPLSSRIPPFSRCSG